MSRLSCDESGSCINNDNNPASLIVGKVYRTLLDPAIAEATPYAPRD